MMHQRMDTLTSCPMWWYAEECNSVWIHQVSISYYKFAGHGRDIEMSHEFHSPQQLVRDTMAQGHHFQNSWQVTQCPKGLKDNPSMDGCLSSTRSIHTVEYYAPMKRSEALTQATTRTHNGQWENQTQKHTQCVILFVGNVQKKTSSQRQEVDSWRLGAEGGE